MAAECFSKAAESGAYAYELERTKGFINSSEKILEQIGNKFLADKYYEKLGGTVLPNACEVLVNWSESQMENEDLVRMSEVEIIYVDGLEGGVTKKEILFSYYNEACNYLEKAKEIFQVIGNREEADKVNKMLEGFKKTTYVNRPDE